jgi:hypothetical protein
MQDNRIEKAYSKLKELEMFSDDFETFSNFFYSNLKEDRKDEAIELLLMVIFGFLKSSGDRFNLLLKKTDKNQADGLKVWLDTQLKKVLK